MSEYHEPHQELSPQVKDIHRALVSLQEEIEAVDWYNQRHSVCTDEALAAILAHNRDEEIEHAAMVLEWLRRTVPAWDRQLRRYLFSEGPLTALEESASNSSAGDASGLGIGSRRTQGEKR